MSHTYTKKWHSEEFTANRKWMAEMNRIAFLEDTRKYAQAKASVASRKAASTFEWQSFSKPTPTPFNGMVFKGHHPCPRGPVLSEFTVWIPMEWYPSFETIAPWPTLEQQKYEGDDRVNSKSGRSFGRFLALPRLPSSNPTVAWTMWNVVPFQPFDMVGPIPTGYDLYMPDQNDLPELEIPNHLNGDLLTAIEDASQLDC
ncbi:MAG: hypothetical protein Q9165_006444 [Trypethelium subeluteriae]